MGRYVLVDVFTDTAFEGNQLAVFPDAAEMSPEQMQRLAREFNFSETLFVEIRQGAEIGRPSTLYARVEGSTDRVEGVEVGGSAVVVAHGEFSL